MRRELRPTLLLLLVTAGLVLSIACVSVSNLTLARLTYRADELSLRAALGATRPRIVRQLLTENLFAAAAGTLAGLLLAQISLDRLTDYVQRGTSVPVDRGLSVAALLCAGAVSVLLLVASAGVPLLRGRASLDAGLPRRPRAPPAQRPRGRTGGALVRAVDRRGLLGAEPAPPAGDRYRILDHQRPDDAGRSELHEISRRRRDFVVLARARTAGVGDSRSGVGGRSRGRAARRQPARHRLRTRSR